MISSLSVTQSCRGWGRWGEGEETETRNSGEGEGEGREVQEGKAEVREGAEGGEGEVVKTLC